MGGVHAVLRHTYSSRDAVTAAAFWTLGIAAANNPTGQVRQPLYVRRGSERGQRGVRRGSGGGQEGVRRG
eukprot:6750345-Pyramimonas_sp.AAC.1